MPRHRIDTHSHYLPDFYREALIANGHANPDGMPAVPQWSETDHLAMMDKLNIQKSIISISSPGVHLQPGLDALAADLARRVNSFAADLKKRHPTRFGYFAVLPLPGVAASLNEIEQAFAEDCDGVVLETNHHGIYLGDKRFDPVFAELDKRNAKVFIHPTTGCFSPAGTAEAGTKNTLKVNPLKERMPAPVMEFFFDTARMVANLFLSGTVRRYPNITYLLSHLGGATPPVLSRFLGFGNVIQGYDLDNWSEEDAIKVLNERFYFDLAGWTFPNQWKGLIDGIGVGYDRILYGSDFPFTPASSVENFSKVMDEGTEAWKDEDTEKAYFGNAEKLFNL
ncbi:amidohydrolase 2 [Tothia fuscella]|uniref:6-methylsalicylate decarboxylase n=1 Tax=Tothia fuscella TaxID=1048955 RepID=A0A9P4U2W1_9PEZI|nr:amidohydrolase 2 [Tothia fuscella]